MDRARLDLTATVSRVHLVVWFGAGLLLSIGSYSFAHSEITHVVIGLTMGISIFIFTMSNRNRPKTRRAEWSLGFVCVAAITYGLWWPLLWNDLAPWFEHQLLTRVITHGYVYYLLHNSSGDVFAGLALISMALAIPIWWITDSRFARLSTLFAGPIGYWWFEFGVENFSNLGQISYIIFFGRVLTSPALSMYLMVCGPLFVLARMSLPKRMPDLMICQSCGYCLEGLASDAVCPECGQARQVQAASRSA